MAYCPNDLARSPVAALCKREIRRKERVQTLRLEILSKRLVVSAGQHDAVVLRNVGVSERGPGTRRFPGGVGGELVVEFLC